MTGFDEKRTVQAALVDLLVESGWTYVPGSELPRTSQSVIIETDLRAAIERLNPVLGRDVERVDAVVARVRQAILAAGVDGLIAANEGFTDWLRGRKSVTMPDTNQDEPVRLVDFDIPANNRMIVSDEVSYGAGAERARFDVVLWINGLPVVVGETKTPVSLRKSWIDGAKDITASYEPKHANFFVPVLLNFSTEGKQLRYASVSTPLENWELWGDSVTDAKLGGWPRVELSVRSLLSSGTVLRLIEHYSMYDKVTANGASTTVKIIPRYFQFETVEAIVKRVVEGQRKRGLIYHTQGSGKTLAMTWAATQLILDPRMKSPTVVVVADRTQLVRQTFTQFSSGGAPDPVEVKTKAQLQHLLRQAHRGILVTTVHKFDDAGLLSDRDNIIVLVDEAHRTQEGTLGQHMREALPNAYWFGFTGTPIADLTRNTFDLFGDGDDPKRSLSTYNSDRSIADGTTLPMMVVPRPVSFHIDKEALDQEFDELSDAEGLDEEQKEQITRRLSRVKTLLDNPARVRAVARDIVEHFYTHVDPLGMKAQIVVDGQQLCIDYHDELVHALEERGIDDEIAVVISASGDKGELDDFAMTEADEEATLDRFRTFGDKLKFLVVTSKLGTGFNAPIEGVMYLDKPMKMHTLFQTITRTNRPWRNPDTGQPKQYGLVVDYIGLGDGFARAMAPADPEAVKRQLELEELIVEFDAILKGMLGRFVAIPRDDFTHGVLMQLHERIPPGVHRDGFVSEFLLAQGIWETAYPDPRLSELREDYRFVSSIFRSLPQSDDGQALLWARLGAKTRELVYSHISDVEVGDRKLVVSIADSSSIQSLVDDGDLPVPHPEDGGKSALDVFDGINARIRQRLEGPTGANAVYRSIADRLDNLRAQELDRQQASIEWLTELFKVSKDLYEAEEADEAGVLDDFADPRIGMLTKIFEENKPKGWTVLVADVVAAVDNLVRQAVFENWKSKESSERELRKELRRLFRTFKLPVTGEPLESAWAYIAKYY